MVVVDAHYAPDVSADLPTHITTDGAGADAIAELIDRLAADAATETSRDRLHPLLVAQVAVLVSRLELAAAISTGAPSRSDRVPSELFRSYERAIDDHFREWHRVSDYARSLGCTTKTLLRASQAARGSTAKRLIVQRIIVEANRMLALRPDPVERIGAELGFDEPTNFTKFFRRETGRTPKAFRATVRAPTPTPPVS